MKKFLATMILSCVSLTFAAAQTTYTTTQDACAGKANQACFNIPVVDQNGFSGVVSIDNRSETSQYNFYLGPFGTNGYHGEYSGFVANPDGTKNEFNGVASYTSDDATLVSQFQFHAYYVKVCSGRGCGGTLGWHFRILAGSTVTVQ